MVLEIKPRTSTFNKCPTTELYPDPGNLTLLGASVWAPFSNKGLGQEITPLLWKMKNSLQLGLFVVIVWFF
jgi:hypothetical protein